VPTSWEVQHFSLALPEGTDRSDVPALLRSLADHLEARGAIEVHDVVMGSENTAEGPVPHFTVYFHPKDGSESNS